MKLKLEEPACLLIAEQCQAEQWLCLRHLQDPRDGTWRCWELRTTRFAACPALHTHVRRSGSREEGALGTRQDACSVSRFHARLRSMGSPVGQGLELGLDQLLPKEA